MLLMMDLSAAADSSIVRGTWLFPVDDRQNTIREIAKHASVSQKGIYLRNLRVEQEDTSSLSYSHQLTQTKLNEKSVQGHPLQILII